MKTVSRENMLKDALEALEASHSPYSNFKVGAALLTDDGSLFTGCNIENASYGLTICAERSAIASAVSAGHKDFIAIAIVAQDASGNATPYPCGACLQVLSEFCKPDFLIHVAGSNGIETLSLADLMPKTFKL